MAADGGAPATTNQGKADPVQLAPIIIKKVKKGGHAAHHGGAWKVAYADFVTAMMAFFLMLWLLNATTEEQKAGISNYFAPEAITYTKSGSGGMMGGRKMSSKGSGKSNSSPQGLVVTIPKRTDGSKEGTPGGKNTDGLPGGGRSATSPGGNEKAGLPGGKSTVGLPGGKTKDGPRTEAERRRAADRKMMVARKTEGKPVRRLSKRKLYGPRKPKGKPGKSAAKGKPGKSAAGGKMMAARKSEGKPGRSAAEGKKPFVPKTPAEIRKAADEEEKAFKKATAEIRKAIAQSPGLKEFAKNLVIDRSPRGLRIQLIDRSESAMFPRGSSRMHKYTKQLLLRIAVVLRKFDNEIAVAGHTDGVQYVGGGGYSNWELSADRANASRRFLMRFGVPANRIVEVVGRADRDPLIKEKPEDPRNRRISITLLRKYNPAPEKPTGKANTETKKR